VVAAALHDAAYDGEQTAYDAGTTWPGEGVPAAVRARLVTAAAAGAARLVAAATGHSAGERRRAERAGIALAKRVVAGGRRPARVDLALAAACGTRAARRVRRDAAPLAALRSASGPALDALRHLPLPGHCPWSVGPVRALLGATDLLGPRTGQPVRVDLGVSPRALGHLRHHAGHRPAPVLDAAGAAAHVDGVDTEPLAGTEAGGCDLRAVVADVLLRTGDPAPARVRPAVAPAPSRSHLVRRVFLYEHAACDAALPHQEGAVVTVRVRGGHRVTYRVAPGGSASGAAHLTTPSLHGGGGWDDEYAGVAAELLSRLTGDRSWRLTG
jgi:hypothetical protein